MAWTFEEDVAAYGRHGFSAIEITEAKLDHARLDQQFEVLRAAGLAVASVQAEIHGVFPTKLQPEPTNPNARLEHMRKSIESLAPYLPPGIVRTIHDAGYRRPYVIEIFSSESLQDSLWTRDLDETLADSARAFQKIWEHAVAR